jgi:hypothetical protein
VSSPSPRPDGNADRIRRCVAITRNGRFVAFGQPDGIHAVDVLGTAPRRTIASAPSRAFACVGNDCWFTGQDTRLWRIALDRDDAPCAVDAVAGPPSAIVPVLGTASATAVVEHGDGAALVECGAAPRVRALDAIAPGRVLAGHGRNLIVARDHRAELRIVGRDVAVALPPLGGVALGASPLFGGRAFVVWVREAEQDALVVHTSTGQRIHRIASPPLVACAIAEQAGLAIGLGAGELRAIDLRYAALRATAPAPPAVIALDVDADARRIVLAGTGDDGALAVSLAAYDDLFRSQRSDGAPAAPVEPSAPAADPTPAGAPERVTGGAPDERAPLALPDPGLAGAGEDDAADDAIDDAAAIDVPDLVPVALEPITAPPVPVAPHGAAPFARPGDHLAALLDLVAARAALAIADGWHTGRISRDVEGGLPYEHEVLGLVGEDVGLAADALRQARIRLAERAAALRSRVLASLAAGMPLPFVDLARELALSPYGTQVMLCAAAPRLRADVARLYGVLTGVAGRGSCDDFLVHLLVAETADDRDRLAHELAPDAPLVRSGVIRLDAEADRTILAVDEVLLDRLRGHVRRAEISAATTRRDADRELAALRVPASVIRELVLALAVRDPRRPARVVLRGRRGAGRHALAAALAGQAGRSIAAIDTARLPRAGAALAGALRTELVRARIAGAVPVVSGLERIDPADVETRHLVTQAVAAHCGPIFVRTTPEGDLPIEADHVAVVLPPLSLGERAAAWSDALARRGLIDPTVDPSRLATRFRFGPGAIERVCDDVARRACAGAIAPRIDEVARQHIAVRLGRVATRVDRLPDWNQVTLIDDMRDSVRELIGRARHQRTVFEDWGFDRRITSARGLTALFYGPPGTGKTLVAGLIARELGLELWRIDLARVMSKWLGETEKNLGEVFDAAEEGQVLLLFDEADSLFARRTEVKSSNDRYANLEVNYLLQRLDSFEGVAILTTNLEGSVDSAFKRRLSMRLYFPFPDEELRAQLWAAHIPPEAPCDGPLDFAELARRFPLSGGYIRNSALRAAFLAAQERRALAQDHLVRAVQLEYRELGKLAPTGRME